MAKSVKVNALLNVSRQIVSTIFPLITVPYATRILGAADYGAVNYTGSIISYFVLLAGLGISTYATREGARIRNDRQKFTQFASEMLTINVISCAIAYALLFILLICWRGERAYLTLLVIQSFTIAANTFGMDWINTAFEDYAYLTIRYIAFQVLSLFALLIFVHSPQDSAIYAFCTILPTFGGNICNLWYVRRYAKVRLTRHIHLKQHIRAIMTLFANNLASVIYLSSDQTLLGILKDARAVGLYSLPVKIYTVIQGAFNALTYVMVPRLSALINAHDEKAIHQILDNTFRILLTTAVPSSIGLFFLSHDIITVLSGEQYASGTPVLRILSLTLFVSVFNCFFANGILIPFRKENDFLAATSIAAVLNLVLNFIFIPLWGISGAAITTLISEIYILAHVGISSRKIYVPTIPQKFGISILFGGLAVTICCWLSITFIQQPLLRIIIAILSSVVLYFFIEITTGNELVKDLLYGSLKRIARRFSK